MTVRDFRLPSPPQIAAKVIELAADPKSTLADLAEIAKGCPPFAAELLRVANSPAYGGGNIKSAERAVSILGIRTMRNLALCWSARNCVKPKEIKPFDLDRFWEDSLRRAVAAELLAESLGMADPNEAFTAGLLQDLGVLVLMLNNKDQADRWMTYVDASPDARRVIEMELFDESHDSVASRLRSEWQLPSSIFEVMEHHHDTPNETHAPLVKLARWGESFASQLMASDKKAALSHLYTQLYDEAKLDRRDVDELSKRLGQEVEKRAQSMGLRVSAQPSYEDIVTAANRSLAEMNLNYEQLIGELEATKAQLEHLLAEKRKLARELAEKNIRLTKVSQTDSLTGLPNRRGYKERMELELVRSARSGSPVCLLMGDIDHFKTVNDTWGHDFGDRVISAVAAVLKANLRRTDFAARIGGEEFAIVLPETGLEGGLLAADKLLERLRSRKLHRPDNTRGNVTLSLGAAVIQGPCTLSFDVNDCIERLYRSADAALYKSKRGGRDRVTPCDEVIEWVTVSREQENEAA